MTELKRAGILSQSYDPETEKYIIGKDGHNPNIRHNDGKFADVAFSELATIDENTKSGGGVRFPDGSKAWETIMKTAMRPAMFLCAWPGIFARRALRCSPLPLPRWGGGYQGAFRYLYLSIWRPRKLIEAVEGQG